MGNMKLFYFAPIVVFILVSLIGFGFSQPSSNVEISGTYHPLDRMPLVIDGTEPTQVGIAPEEQRGPEFKKWLQASVKIRASGSSGSGTICYYDSAKNEAWVISCGHLWSGSKNADELKRQPLNAKIVTWYHNNQKLSSPKEYPAQVLFYSNRRGYDLSLLKFKPDWDLEVYFPIAPLNHNLNSGQNVHSLGCDGAREVAHYAVQITDLGGIGRDLKTKFNSPRPGRSGGGLMDDNYFIGICWGTTAFDGSGTGLFTSLGSIHKLYKENGYGWLLNMPTSSGMARRIPIRNMDGYPIQFPRNYIPLPNRL